MRSVLTAQLGRGRHRVRVEVKGPDPGAQLMSGQREQPAAASYVEERTARQVGDPQRLSQGPARALDSRLVDKLDKGFPVRPEGEAAAG